MLIMYKKAVFFSFLFFLLSALLCFGEFVGSEDSAMVNESEFIKNEKSNGGVFNSVEYASFKGYRGDGSFVEAPARVGDWTGYIIGVLPAVIITEPIRLLSIQDYEGENIGVYTLYGTTKFFGCLFGGPSFILKGIFYDVPVWIYTSIFGRQAVSTSWVQHEEEIIKPVVETKTEEEKDVSYYRWNPEEFSQSEITSISIKPSMLTNKETFEKKKRLTAKAKESGRGYSETAESSAKVFYAEYLPIFLSGLFLPIAEPIKDSLDVILDESALTDFEEQEILVPVETKKPHHDEAPVKKKTTEDGETSWSSPSSSVPSWVKEKIEELENK